MARRAGHRERVQTWEDATRKPSAIGRRPSPPEMRLQSFRSRRPNAKAGHTSARHRDADVLPTYLYDATTPRRLTTPGHYAYVKIAEGCDYNCAFCIIPKLRGALPQPR